MKILISNDDSVYAKGITLLHKYLSEIAEVKVIAPDRDSSAASNSLTITGPIRAKTLSNGFISVEGTPTDSVHVGVTSLLDWKPDYIISGINHGANLGEDVIYSGTVAAAMEGILLGIPSIAISLASESSQYLETGARVAAKLVSYLDAGNIKTDSLLNVNVPSVPYADLQGMEITRLGTRHHAEDTIEDTDPRGKPIYWIGPPGSEQDAGSGSDFYAINSNKVSITPIKVDMTDYQNFDSVDTILKKLSFN